MSLALFIFRRRGFTRRDLRSILSVTFFALRMIFGLALNIRLFFRYGCFMYETIGRYIRRVLYVITRRFPSLMVTSMETYIAIMIRVRTMTYGLIMIREGNEERVSRGSLDLECEGLPSARRSGRIISAMYIGVLYRLTRTYLPPTMTIFERLIPIMYERSPILSISERVIE